MIETEINWNKTPFDVLPKRPGIKISELEELINPTSELVRKLHTNIINGEYALLVGDDTTGRIPTLILRQIINKLYSEYDREPISTLFYSKKFNIKEKNTFILSAQKSITKPSLKALFVTDYIFTGNTINFIKATLNKANINFEVASLFTDWDYPLKNGSGNNGVLIHSGKRTSSNPGIYNNKSFSGVLRLGNETLVNKHNRSNALNARREVPMVVSHILNSI